MLGGARALRSGKTWLRKLVAYSRDYSMVSVGFSAFVACLGEFFELARPVRLIRIINSGIANQYLIPTTGGRAVNRPIQKLRHSGANYTPNRKSG